MEVVCHLNETNYFRVIWLNDFLKKKSIDQNIDERKSEPILLYGDRLRAKEQASQWVRLRSFYK